MNFLARLYERGTGESIPATVSFQDDMIIIYLEENGNEPISVPLAEWEVRVGGSAEDKIVLQAHQTGDTLICGDELFLTAIAEATNNADILKQIAKAKRRNSTRFIRQSTGIAAVLICLTMFGGCVALGFIDAVKHPHKSRYSETKAEEEAQETEEANENSSTEASKTSATSTTPATSATPSARRTKAKDAAGVKNESQTPQGKLSAKGQEPNPSEDVVIEPFDGARYMDAVKVKIRNTWRPPAGLKPMKVVIHFTVSKSGKTSNPRIATSSGNKACDDSAIKTISEISPLPKLGSGSPPAIDIEYTFDYVGKKASAQNPAGVDERSEMRHYD